VEKRKIRVYIASERRMPSAHWAGVQAGWAEWSGGRLDSGEAGEDDVAAERQDELFVHD
jgi:hypothetical protein